MDLNLVDQEFQRICLFHPYLIQQNNPKSSKFSALDVFRTLKSNSSLYMKDPNYRLCIADSLSIPSHPTKYSDQIPTQKFKKIYKATTIALILGLFLTYRFLHEHPYTKNSVVDNLHQWTFNLNRWISNHASVLCIALGQLMMDVNIGYMTIYWVLFVNNFRFVVVTGLFQYFRQLMLKITTMPFESYAIWFNPGLPSWTVAYDHTSDYFFSGHTGTLAILYLQARKLNLPKFIQVYFIFTLVYMVSMLLVARVHYTIDIVGGLVYSAFFYGLVEDNVNFFDQIMNAPWKVFTIVKQKVKKELLLPQQQGTSMFEIEHS